MNQLTNIVGDDMAGGYHDAFAIKQKGNDGIVCIDGHFHIYKSIQAAALNLTVLAAEYPGREFTIGQLRIPLPWTKQGF